MPNSSAIEHLMSCYMARHPMASTSFIEKFSDKELAEAFSQMNKVDRQRLKQNMGAVRLAHTLSQLSEDNLSEFFSLLDPAEISLCLGALNSEQRGQLQARLPENIQKDLENLTSYPDSSAASMMDPQVLAFSPSTPISTVLEKLRLSSRQSIYEVYIVEAGQILKGRATTLDLAVSDHSDRLSSIMKPCPAAIKAFSTREEVADIFETSKVTTLPVVNDDYRLLGVIRHKALIQNSEADMSGSMLTMVGASPEEKVLSSPITALKKRFPWLAINLLTAFLASAVVGLFENTIAQITALAVLLPVVAGQSGNTGAQAMAVTMRGLAIREVRTAQWFKIVIKELGSGFLNGVLVSIITAVAVVFWSGVPSLGAVIGIAMILSMTIASVAGAIVPLILTSLGKDPAQSSSIVLTTVTDVFGFFSFLGLATLMIKYLVP